MERFGIKQEEVVCIGDTMNDYEMVKHAGLGVAMANGDERLKEAGINRGNTFKNYSFSTCTKLIENYMGIG